MLLLESARQSWRYSHDLTALGIEETHCSGIMENKTETTIMENQMEKKMENEMEYIGVIYYSTFHCLGSTSRVQVPKNLNPLLPQNQRIPSKMKKANLAFQALSTHSWSGMSVGSVQPKP